MNNKIFLTESEKNRILGMHKNAIINENKNLVIEADVKQIQQLLVDKGFMGKTKPNGKDAVDGGLGPITMDAIYNFLSQTGGASGSSGVSGTQGTSGVAGTQGTSGVAGTQGTSGVAGTQGTPAQGTNTGTPSGTDNVNDTKLEVGKVYEGTNQDNAQGKILKVLSITPINGCDVKEVALKMTQGAGYTLYGYLQGSDLSASNMRRSGEGTKSQNPCEEIKKDMVSFGVLQPEGTMKKLGLT